MHDTDDSGRGPVQLRLSCDPDLEYLYYDVFNVFVGPEEVVLEFGNRHRADPETGTIHQRVVLSPGTARQLVQTLGQGVRTMEERVREAFSGAGRGKPN
ncbi:MAG: DUF3467 domain-containing protein [Desulfovibrionaceae bacterium]